MRYRFFLTLGIVFASSLLLLCMSCNMGHRSHIQPKRWMKLSRELELLQDKLPRQIDKGIMLVKAEYIDSVYTTWMEVDDKIISFEDMMKLSERRKKEVICDASVAEGQERNNYEMYVEYNIRMRMVYVGKYSHKQTEFTVTPSEIDEALHTKLDAYSRLQNLIFSAKAKSSDDMEGTSDPILSLQDSIVYLTIALDESMYDVMSLKDSASANAIMEEMLEINPQLIRYMADAKCGFIYRVIGLNSKKGFDIDIPLRDVLYYKRVLDSRFEIVESDE